MPRITILSQWFPPEQAPFGRMMQELAGYLAGRGWEVTVITGFPNHPTGQVFGGYRKRWIQRESIGGVRVLRVWLATSSRRTVLTRLLTFASFTCTASWRLLRGPRPDVIFAVLQPLSMGVILPILARLTRARLVFNLQDLHPDAQIRLGIVRNPLLIRLLRVIEARAYRSCDELTVISDSFRRHAIQRGAAADRVRVIENWVDTERIRPMPAAGLEYRREIGLQNSDFVVLWAGTLGYVSGASVMLEAARLLQGHPRVRLLVVGEGPLRGQLVQTASEHGLTNVMFRPFEPESRLAAMQSCSDASVVTLAPGLAEVSVPSKVLAYLAAGRPIIASVASESETARLIREAEAGVVVPPGDPGKLAEAICALISQADVVQRLSSAARSYAVERLSQGRAMTLYEGVLAGGKRSA